MHSEKSREEMARESINLARNIPDDREQIQVIAGILTATDKFADDEISPKIREWLSMTKVGRIIEKEIEQEREVAKAENTRKLAKKMLKRFSALFIGRVSIFRTVVVKEKARDPESVATDRMLKETLAWRARKNQLTSLQ
ncbi:hypothetical protein [Salicibibacter kimchii]|uniref:Uncharacterized protein n=1 Tax=Salicibibacter kimchii TaxID=2099786 RepID=A0A345BWE4_9BACI|nr:hypothetical protein [Salicibibacter kimchii]AXF55275.1 hypothetical protein DT065_04065 [Salicibibacter kimchii]